MTSLFPFANYWWLYGTFTGFVLLLLVLDLGVFHRMAHVVGFREAATWSAVYRGADARMATRSASRRSAVLSRPASSWRRPIEGSTARSGSRPVAELVVPLIFVAVGVNADSQALNPFAQADGFGLALVLTVATIASKLAAGLAVYRRGARRWLVAV